MILAGLMSYSEATSMPPTMFPKQPQWQNYTEVFQKHPFFGISWTQSLFQALQRCYGSHRRVSFIRINEFEVPF